jgi:hypothetical protein
VTWLIALYPPAWRHRYGRELAELIATQPASFGTAIDLVAGAIDAWFNPQSSTAVPAAEAKGAGAMVSEMLQLKCAGHGPAVTNADSRKAAAITIVGSLVAAIAFVWAAAAGYGNRPYLTSLVSISWLVALVFSQRYTTLKGRSARVQAVLIGAQTAFVIGIALAAAWISTRIDN